MISMRRFLSSASVFFLGAAFSCTAAVAAGPDRGPAPTLRAPANARIAPKADGFITRWLLLDPIPGDGRVVDSAIQAAAKKEYFPNQLTILPRDGEKVVSNGIQYQWHALDSSKHNVNLYHFAFFSNQPTTNQVFWGVTVINCPQEMAGVRLAFGSNAGSVWWVNGQEVGGIYGDRQTTIDDGVSKKLILKQGANIVRCLIVNNAGMVDFCARFLDADDKPLTQFTMSLEAH